MAVIASATAMTLLFQTLEGFGEPRDTVDGTIVVSEVMSLLPAQLHASESFLDAVYVQVSLLVDI